MRGPTVTILIVLASVAICAALYWLSGGRLIVFALPLLFLGPLMWRGRRG